MDKYILYTMLMIYREKSKSESQKLVHLLWSRWDDKLCNFILHLYALMERRASLISLLQVLSELVEFMSDPYARRKDHQKLVRNLGVSRIVSLLNLYII